MKDIISIVSFHAQQLDRNGLHQAALELDQVAYHLEISASNDPFSALRLFIRDSLQAEVSRFTAMYQEYLDPKELQQQIAAAIEDAAVEVLSCIKRDDNVLEVSDKE